MTESTNRAEQLNHLRSEFKVDLKTPKYTKDGRFVINKVRKVVNPDSVTSLLVVQDLAVENQYSITLNCVAAGNDFEDNLDVIATMFRKFLDSVPSALAVSNTCTKEDYEAKFAADQAWKAAEVLRKAAEKDAKEKSDAAILAKAAADKARQSLEEPMGYDDVPVITASKAKSRVVDKAAAQAVLVELKRQSDELLAQIAADSDEDVEESDFEEDYTAPGFE